MPDQVYTYKFGDFYPNGDLRQIRRLDIYSIMEQAKKHKKMNDVADEIIRHRPRMRSLINEARKHYTDEPTQMVLLQLPMEGASTICTLFYGLHLASTLQLGMAIRFLEDCIRRIKAEIEKRDRDIEEDEFHRYPPKTKGE